MQGAKCRNKQYSCNEVYPHSPFLMRHSKREDNNDCIKHHNETLSFGTLTPPLENKPHQAELHERVLEKEVHDSQAVHDAVKGIHQLAHELLYFFFKLYNLSLFFIENPVYA